MAPSNKKQRDRGVDADALTVVVCRGGDCGSRAKHPDVDHVGLLRQMRDRIGGSARVAPSKCLEACEHSNVVVVVPGARDGEQVWVGGVNDRELNTALSDFVRAGGPGVAMLPIELELQQFRASRRSRQELDVERSTTGRRG
ncbi:hypothetical protein [Agrococcus carbonis]|uniref:hypothetical protein n=1 Tax=Agrococcus carbonis TaxID=684552 RepID=UPI000B8398A6|nr:hypothetical protein [Agrococcus carbonis]